MCGICGFVSKRRISADELVAANNEMYRRGPNDSGVEIFETYGGYSLGFGHRRLSILDLSELGHQPMHSTDNRISVVFNGEIYNFKEIRNELSDYSFKSNSDTEVIIASYLKWGIDCINHFNGMFAIALYDRSINELFLVRDRIGKKPLYYWLDRTDIYFASELKAIMKMPGFEKTLNKSVLSSYLFHQYIASPNTIFSHVYKLEPGQYLKFNAGNIELVKYWEPESRYRELSQNTIEDYYEAKESLKDLLVDSVKHRMIADVPVGTFLSGGIDSTLVTAIAQSVTNRQINTFSIGFEEKELDEAVYAAQIARHIGTNHTELYITEDDMKKIVDDLPIAYDEPFADNSQIPTIIVSRLAKDNVTVALSGDGGDELFCGYGRYDSLLKVQKFDIISETLGKVIPSGIVSKLPYKAKVLLNNIDNKYKTQFASYWYEDIIKQNFLEEADIRFDESDLMQYKNWQIRGMLLDQRTYMPDDILCKMDRGAMWCSLESRAPILDYRIIEYSYKIPHRFKYNNGKKKYILKDIAYDYVPKELLDRPKKGFGVPIGKWLRGDRKEELLCLSDAAYLKQQGIFKQKELTLFIEKYLQGDVTTNLKYDRLVWSFYMFQKWYEYWMK
ncbi:MAG: asparagine synthase (glutamine-hydrolyzing) [Lachnospiraceae bacterium]|nr:asparagine synthase (glutamine-hydrolyzing) [Lachnospiraceae bacterium]